MDLTETRIRNTHAMSTEQVPKKGGRQESIGDFARLGVLTVSDRASHGVYDDLSGPAILRFFGEAIDSRCLQINLPLSVYLQAFRNPFFANCLSS